MDTIYSYTRKQALEDGVLIDVSKTAKEAGFKVPVAVTNGLYFEYIEPSEELKQQGQSATGRLWDMLFILHLKFLIVRKLTRLFILLLLQRRMKKQSL